ncbi:MAG: asparagine synthase (glutamine-hydrolyzing) [Vicinamibacterales bacterium]
MCGIAGEWRFDDGVIDPRRLRRATSLIAYRGPDDEGYLLARPETGFAEPRRGEDSVDATLPHVESECRTGPTVGFGFRRLAIVDLSEAGHQPMASPDGSLWLVFNGEIYNHIELREELAARGHVFRSHCDTEVILAAYAEWGTECLGRFNGMWAFALLDLRRRVLFAARDRFGIKPFYYRLSKEAFHFGSEIKSVQALAGATPEVNDAVLGSFLTAGTVDADDQTFHKGVLQLPPAHFLTVDASGARLTRYWKIDLLAAEDDRPLPVLTAELRSLFEDVIRIHLRSDVPIGTCLSGGLDSSAIACAIHGLLGGTGRQQVFSAYFDDPAFDERPFMRQVVDRIGSEGNYVSPASSDLLRELPDVLRHQDEPFATTSIYAQWSLMALARSRGIKVLLDGQGGDELFAGYHTFYGAWFADLLNHGRFSRLASEVGAYRRMHRAPLSDLVLRTLEPLGGRRLSAMARRLIRGESVGVHPDLLGERTTAPTGPSLLTARLHELLTTATLPGLLRYEDRDSMAFSIEARVPFLDVRLVEFAFRLPGSAKIRNGWTKAILRDALADQVPVGVARRTDKMGFLTPEAEWLRGPLQAWAREIIFSPEFCARPYFDVKAAHGYFERFISGQEHRSGPIWRWIVLDLWIRQQVEGRSLPTS